MAVTSTATYIIYNAPGTQTSFSFPYYFISQQDLMVSGSLSGVVYNYTLNNDYTISGTPNPFGDYNNGANVVFNSTPNNSPPGGGTTLLISRRTPRTQTVILLDNAAYTADTFNHVFDKLTLITQETGINGSGGNFLGVILGPPTAGSGIPGNWYQIVPPIPGGPFGIVCTAPGVPGTWNYFGNISLL